MEELIPVLPKIAEWGAVGAALIILILRGIPAMNKLAESNIQLANAIGRLTDSVNNRLEVVEHDLRDIKASLDVILRRLDFIEHPKNNREKL